MQSKNKLGAKNFLYPMPTILVGAMVDGKPNFITIAYCGIVQNVPPMIEITSGKIHYTNAGIKENKTFSVNIPSENMLKVTDYCGLVSGKKTDKSQLFNVFYGELKTAPMIQECPVNLECRLVDVLDYGGTNEIFIGEIIQTYSEENYISNGVPDITRVKPIIFSMYDGNYWSVGHHLGKAWEAGKEYLD